MAKVETWADSMSHTHKIVIELTTAEVTALLEDGQYAVVVAGDSTRPALDITVREVTAEETKRREAAKRLPPIGYELAPEVKMYSGYDIVDVPPRTFTAAPSS
jgi:hypothetical protein